MVGGPKTLSVTQPNPIIIQSPENDSGDATPPPAIHSTVDSADVLNHQVSNCNSDNESGNDDDAKDELAMYKWAFAQAVEELDEVTLTRDNAEDIALDMDEEYEASDSNGSSDEEGEGGFSFDKTKNVTLVFNAFLTIHFFS